MAQNAEPFHFRPSMRPGAGNSTWDDVGGFPKIALDHGLDAPDGQSHKTFRRAWLHSRRDLGGVVGRIFRAGGRHAEQAWHWSNGTESQVPVCGFCGWPTSIKVEEKVRA